MARKIYEVKLQESYFPAVNKEDALEMWYNGESKGLSQDEMEVKAICEEEHTVKLFVLAKSMYDTEKFGFNEIQTAVRALALELGYHTTYEEVADCVLLWTERFDDMEMSELEEWLIG